MPSAAEAKVERDTWGIRRAIIRARRGLTAMRLREASKATAHVRRLLDGHDAPPVCYGAALRMLEAFILIAEDKFSAARNLLVNVELHADNAIAADHPALPVSGKAACRIFCLCVSAVFAFDRLQLTVSAHLATEALQLARTRYGNHSPMSTFPATLLAQVAYEQGRCDEAEALLRPRFQVIRASGLPECVARASVLLARLSLQRGQHRSALALLRETAALGRARCWPRLVSTVSTEYARTLEALRHEQYHPVEARPSRDVLATASFPHGCRLPQLLARRDADDPRPAGAMTFPAVEGALRRASSAASAGSIEECYTLLIPCLRIGAARGLCMTFVDAGPPLLAVLEHLYYALRTSDDPHLTELRPYIATVLRSTRQSACEDSSSITYRSLSRRETSILQMIALGMSNKRIAQSLGIAPETVKHHAKGIFVKLATHTRAQAVARAEAAGFLG